MDDHSTRTATRPVPIGELLAAWLAVQRGDFRHRRQPACQQTTVDSARAPWQLAPGEAPVLVIGCAGSVGASTVAVLLATAAQSGRVVECAPSSCSGLAGASTAELGQAAGGWVQGRRGEALIQRRPDRPSEPEAVPPPPAGTAGGVTVVDAWWELSQLLPAASWIADLALTCPRVVLVARASIPGVRRLEDDVALLGAERCWAVLTGAPPRQLPRPVEHSLGPLTRQLRDAERLYFLPNDPRLATSGITTEPLPRSFDRTARNLLEGLLP
jgi:hypothetical protein